LNLGQKSLESVFKCGGISTAPILACSRSSYQVLAYGKKKTFTYFDRTAWHKAQGKRKNLPLEQFVKTVSIEYTPLPQHLMMNPDARQSYIRRGVRTLEQRFQKEREVLGRPAMGAAALSRLNHRSRPKNSECLSSTQNGNL
jgi:hypothetical protein